MNSEQLNEKNKDESGHGIISGTDCGSPRKSQPRQPRQSVSGPRTEPGNARARRRWVSQSVRVPLYAPTISRPIPLVTLYCLTITRLGRVITGYI